MMGMVYLTFTDEAEALAALYDGEAPRYPAFEILNPVPMPVSRTTGEVGADGAPILEPVPGYHVYCVGTCPQALERWRGFLDATFVVLAGVEPQAGLSE